MSSRPNVKRLARRKRFDALAAAAQYHDWAQLRDGSYVDLGITVRRDTVDALADSEDPRGAVVLSRALSDAAAPVRVAAVTALERRLDPAVASTLATAYLRFDAAGDDLPRSAALVALRSDPNVTAAPVVRTVIEGLGQGDLDASETGLLRALAAGGSEATELVVAGLVDALADETGATAARAVEGLVALGADSVPALLEAMDDHLRRAGAAIALGRCGDGRAVEALIGLLGDPRSDVRRAAAGTLGDLRDPRAVAPLIAAAQDVNHKTRVAAASALDRLGSAGLIVEIASISRQSRGGSSVGVSDRPTEALASREPEPSRPDDGRGARPADETPVADGKVLDHPFAARVAGSSATNRRTAGHNSGAIGRLRELGASLATFALARMEASRGREPIPPASPTGGGDQVPEAGGLLEPVASMPAGGAPAARRPEPTPAAGALPAGPADAAAEDMSTPFAPAAIADAGGYDQWLLDQSRLEWVSAHDRAEAASADAAATALPSDVAVIQDHPRRRPEIRARSLLLAALCVPIVAFGVAFAIGHETGTSSASQTGNAPHRPLKLLATTPVPSIRPLAVPKRPRRRAQPHHSARKSAAAPPSAGARYVPRAVRPVAPAGVGRATGPPSVQAPAGVSAPSSGTSTSNGGTAATGAGTSTTGGGGTTTGNPTTPSGSPTVTVISPSGGSTTGGSGRSGAGTKTSGGAVSGGG